MSKGKEKNVVVTMKPFVQRMGMASALLIDARAQLPGEARGMRDAIAQMISDAEEAVSVLCLAAGSASFEELIANYHTPKRTPW